MFLTLCCQQTRHMPSRSGPMSNAKKLSLAIYMTRHHVRGIPKTAVKRMLGILHVAPYQNILVRPRQTKLQQHLA